MEINIKRTFEEIYENESDAIFRFCLLRVSNREQAIDTTEEVFLRLWQSLLKGQKIENTKAFLFTIARRLIIDWYRKKKSLSLDGMLSDGKENEALNEKTTENNLLVGAEGRYLLDKINELSYTNREPVYLRFVEDLSPPEIGKILGISTTAVSVRINRGLVELRKIAGYDNLKE